MKLKNTEKRPTCTYSIRKPNVIYYSILRDLLDKTTVLLCKILGCTCRKHMFQHNCQVAAHFKSESKHLQGAPRKPQPWTLPRCHFHDWARGSTSPWQWHAGCLEPSERVENTQARAHTEIFSAPALRILLYRNSTDTWKENLSGIGTFLLTVTGWIQ